MTHSAGRTGRSPAIARVNNAGAGRWKDTDGEQIVLLHDMPLPLAPSPITRLHRAIAVDELRDDGHHNLTPWQ